MRFTQFQFETSTDNWSLNKIMNQRKRGLLSSSSKLHRQASITFDTGLKTYLLYYNWRQCYESVS